MATLIKNIQIALKIFESSAAKQAEATELGDYRSGKKCYKDIVKAAAFLKDENALDKLFSLLSHPLVGVRMWAASYLLNAYEKEAKATLEEIIQMHGIHSLTAETTLNEWGNGILKI